MCINKIIDVFRHPGKLVAFLGTRGYLKWMDDETYLKILYQAYIGHKLNLENPKGFNEKLQWLKLYDRQERYVELVDKYLVKDFVERKIGKEYVIPTLGIWDSVDDIDFSNLPNQFVLKCNHDSGGVIICKDKERLDISAIKNKLTRRLKMDFFFSGREWPYKSVKRKIIAEAYINDGINEDLNDYKFMCFNGVVRNSFVCTERRSGDGLKVTFFDKEWNKMPFERHYPVSNKKIDKPENYEKMIILAEVLAKDIPFVRVDFYDVNGKIYFGEMTFYPGSGFEEFTPFDWDTRMGSWLILPKKNRGC